MEQRRFLVKSLGEFGFGKKTMESQIMEAVQVLITKMRARGGAPIKTEFAFSGGGGNSYNPSFAQDAYKIHDISLFFFSCAQLILENCKWGDIG